MPTFASASAGASLIPSPAIATVLPSLFNFRTNSCLSSEKRQHEIRQCLTSWRRPSPWALRRPSTSRHSGPVDAAFSMLRELTLLIGSVIAMIAANCLSIGDEHDGRPFLLVNRCPLPPRTHTPIFLSANKSALPIIRRATIRWPELHRL